jgi:hypothetical protein
MAYFKVLYLHFPEMTEKVHRNLQQEYLASRRNRTGDSQIRKKSANLSATKYVTSFVTSKLWFLYGYFGKGVDGS